MRGGGSNIFAIIRGGQIYFDILEGSIFVVLFVSHCVISKYLRIIFSAFLKGVKLFLTFRNFDPPDYTVFINTVP